MTKRINKKDYGYFPKGNQKYQEVGKNEYASIEVIWTLLVR